MKQSKRAYISLGNNTGTRLENLKNAVDLLKQRAGKVVRVSPVYETPAWGFEGDDFLNACLILDTELHPQELLEVLLATETVLGRIRTQESGYQPRSIDLDLLFYDGAVIDEPDLIVPHPHIQKRKFILQPLSDIAPDLIHPILKESIQNLLDHCKDTSMLTRISEGLTCTVNDFSSFNYVAIEGNIGAGKTTLASMLSRDFNGKLLLEQFADNPFLPRFYKDRDRYAFPLEMSFLAERYQQFLNDSNQKDLFRNFMVSDYDIYKSLIFARVTLQDEEFKLYRRLFGLMYKDVTKPDIYVYLYQSTERLLENIKKRGRSYEQQIDPDYLQNINRAYLDFIKTQPELNALVIDISDLDFVKNPQDYQYIIDEIHQFKDKR